MKKLLSAFLLITITAIISRLSFYSPPPKDLEFSTVTEVKREKRVLTVATYNIHHGTDLLKNLRLREMSMLIKDTDIVFISEVDRNYSSRSGYLDQLTLLKKYTGLAYHAYAPTLEKAGLFSLGGSYGIAVLSRFPIKSAETIYLSTSSFVEPRAAIVVEISWSNQLIKVLGTHLSTIEEDRSKQLEEIVVSTLDIDFLLGDLNTRPDNIINILNKLELQSADNKPTFPSNRPTAQIDYILYGKRFTLENGQTIDSLYSDHLPVKARFSWNY